MTPVDVGNSQIATDPRLIDPDAFYARLIGLHEGLSQYQSNRLNAAIILMMANQIGDDALLREILDEAAAAAE
jgi:hypothetical protein